MKQKVGVPVGQEVATNADATKGCEKQEVAADAGATKGSEEATKRISQKSIEKSTDGELFTTINNQQSTKSIGGNGDDDSNNDNNLPTTIN